MKFEQLINQKLALLKEAEENNDQGISQDQEVSDQVKTGGAPEPTKNGETPPEPVTSEGMVYMTELIRKALSIDPDSLTTEQKELYTVEVTRDNADEILHQLTQIIDQN